MFHTVLLAVAVRAGDARTPTGAAVRAVAIQLASQGRSPLYVVTVYRPPPMPCVPHPFSPSGAEAELIRRLHAQEQAIRGVVETTFRAYVRGIECAGIQVVPLVCAGDPGEVILRIATEIPADVVVIGVPRTRQPSALGRTAQALWARAPMPIVIVASGQSPLPSEPSVEDDPWD